MSTYSWPFRPSRENASRTTLRMAARSPGASTWMLTLCSPCSEFEVALISSLPIRVENYYTTTTEDSGPITFRNTRGEYFEFGNWSGARDLNPGPHGPEL